MAYKTRATTMIRCDKCNFIIRRESDIKEYIICGQCNYNTSKPDHIHCFTCGAKRNWDIKIKTIKKICNPIFSRRALSIATIAIMLLLAFACFKPLVATRIIFGILSTILALPLVALLGYIAIRIILFVVFTGVKRLGAWVSQYYTDDISDTDARSIIQWGIGLVLLASPFLFYLFGVIFMSATGINK